MSWYVTHLGDAPEKPEIGAEKSAKSQDDALDKLTTAYVHGTTAYLLKQKDDEGVGPWNIKLPKEVEIIDQLLVGPGPPSSGACEYAGREYMYVTESEGREIVAEAEVFAAEKVDSIRSLLHSFVQAEPEEIGNAHDEMYVFHGQLTTLMPVDENAGAVSRLREYIAEEYWDEDLARIFRETVADQVPKAFSIQSNIAAMLTGQLKAYREIVEHSWKSIYAILQAGVDVFFELAAGSAPEKSISYTQLIGLMGPAVKSAYPSFSAAVDTAAAGAAVLETTSRSGSITGDSPSALHVGIHEALTSVMSDAEERFTELQEELSLLDSVLADIPLHAITLPQISSVF